MKHIISTLALASTLIAPALAQQKAGDPVVQAPAAAASASASASAAEFADGEIRKVDKEAKKLTIRHGEIKSLDMPPMTMVFQVRNGAMLDQLKPGDKIRFAAEKAPSGYVVTDIRAAP